MYLDNSVLPQRAAVVSGLNAKRTPRFSFKASKGRPGSWVLRFLGDGRVSSQKYERTRRQQPSDGTESVRCLGERGHISCVRRTESRNQLIKVKGWFFREDVLFCSKLDT
jgi:hypothetical protein